MQLQVQQRLLRQKKMTCKAATASAVTVFDSSEMLWHPSVSQIENCIQWAPPSAAGPLDYGFWEVRFSEMLARSRQILNVLIF